MQSPESSPLQLLYSQALRSELNHLLWIKPFVNRGTKDFGWSCRDHAFISGIVAQLLGLSVEFVSGEALFVRGKTNASPGLAAHQQMHSWLMIEGHGLMDISVRLHMTSHHWSQPDIAYVASSACAPRGEFHMLETREAFKAAVMTAPSLRGEHAFYLAEKTRFIDRAMAQNAFSVINSPLTTRLSKQYSSTLYAKLAMHSYYLACGRAESLATQPGNTWKKIARLPYDAMKWLTENGGFR